MSRSLAQHLLAQARNRIMYDTHIKPADFTVYAWVLAVLSFEGVSILEVSASQIALGVKVGDRGKFGGVGLTLNTVKASLSALEKAEWLIIKRTPSTKGECLSISLP